MVDLGVLPGANPNHSTVQDVSEDGNVLVGESNAQGGGGLAFRWTEGTGMVAMGDLPGGTTGSVALAISPNARWIVGQGTAAEGIRATRWDESGNLLSLGALPSQVQSYARAWDVSDDGRVIIGDSNGIMFLWTPEMGMRSFVDVLADHGIDLAELGWTLTELSGVSADGHYFSATLRRQSNYVEGALIYLPLPAPSAAPVLLMLVAFQRRRTT